MSQTLRLVAALLAASVPVAAGAQAGGLAAARASGVVGERYDGYLGFVATPPTALRKQVVAINIKRRALYTDLAGRRGAAASEVGLSAGCALLGRIAVGERYLLVDGAWRQRAPGQSAPRPDYCG